jgi:hypothetical protein
LDGRRRGIALVGQGLEEATIEAEVGELGQVEVSFRTRNRAAPVWGAVRRIFMGMPPRGGAICDDASGRSTGGLPKQPSRDWNANIAPDEPERSGEMDSRDPKVKASLPRAASGVIKAACPKAAACCS